MSLAALELFCGIGGFAAAVAGSGVNVVGALDQSPAALAVYRLNYPDHPVRQVDLERITAAELAGYGAELWWLSPPCQPYSVRGRGRDLDDPRARSLARLLDVIPELPDRSLPRSLALENVAGFASSRARERLTELLAERGYVFREKMLCPTALGVPSRRPRYYLTASRDGLVTPSPPCADRSCPLNSFLDPTLREEMLAALLVPAQAVARFGAGLRILDGADATAYTTCFTAGYGKSLMHAGAYLKTSAGVRRFSPGEIARLLGFPQTFSFPDGMPLRKRWQLLGNSLSVTAVRAVLTELPGFGPPGIGERG